MKKFLKMLILSTLSIFLVAGFAMAYPYIEVEGYVNPCAANISDNYDGTSTLTGLQYTFVVTDSLSSSEMIALSLEFENDVFKSVSNLVFVQPTDWSVSEITSSSGSLYEVTSSGPTGTSIGLGEFLQFTLDVIMYNDAFSDSTLWQEGQIWSQSFTSFDTNFGSDGGSTTTAPVPEPATILLLGSGLLGLVGYNRKRFSKKS